MIVTDILVLCQIKLQMIGGILLSSAICSNVCKACVCSVASATHRLFVYIVGVIWTSADMICWDHDIIEVLQQHASHIFTAAVYI